MGGLSTGGGGEICQCAFVSIIGCIGLNLSKIGDIDESHLSEPWKKSLLIVKSDL